MKQLTMVRVLAVPALRPAVQVRLSPPTPVGLVQGRSRACIPGEQRMREAGMRALRGRVTVSRGKRILILSAGSTKLQ